MFFDPMYLLFVAPAMLLAAWAQFRVHRAFAEASKIAPQSGYSGAQAADAVLQAASVEGVNIEPTEGFLSDHYVPKQKILRLSPDVFDGRSLAALGIAAHEAGHAIQDAQRYPLLVMRGALVPLASIGSNMSWIAFIVGIALSGKYQSLGMNLVYAGIALFSLTVIFQLINLPVEFDASRRARLALAETGLTTPAEDVYVKKVLDAAALTYVAATLTSALTLLYYLYRSGLIGGNRD